MDKGIIILLNGVSSSGKTTLSKALQNKASDVYWWLANDTFCDMAPEKLWHVNQPETEYMSLHLLGKTVKLFSDLGENVIVDTVMIDVQKHDLYKEYMALLAGYPVCTVHVTCPITELQRREKERGDRNIGQAESQLSILRPKDSYDIIIDTFDQTTEECVDIILEFVEKKYKHLT